MPCAMIDPPSAIARSRMIPAAEPLLAESLRSPPADDPAADRLVAAAIERLARDWQAPPDLDALAAEAGMSPGHFQRVFKRRAGISPKRFAQFVTLGHARRLLREGAAGGLLGASLDLGLSGPSRLHDLFVVAEAATPGEYKAGGAGVAIRYGFHDSPLGRVLLAATGRGLCFLGFVPVGEEARGLAELRQDWPGAALAEDPAATAQAAAAIFAPVHGAADDGTGPDGAAPGTATVGRAGGPLTLHLRGTNFQIKVWQALLEIPFGRVATYADVARSIGHPTSARAVGNAVGANRVSFLIPCHRVIRGTGVLDNYRWGPVTKRALLAWEGATTGR